MDTSGQQWLVQCMIEQDEVIMTRFTYVTCQPHPHSSMVIWPPVSKLTIQVNIWFLVKDSKHFMTLNRKNNSWLNNYGWVDSLASLISSFSEKLRGNKEQKLSISSRAHITVAVYTAAMNWNTFSQRIFTECWVDIIPVLLEAWRKSRLQAECVPRQGEWLWLQRGWRAWRDDAKSSILLRDVRMI